MERTLIICYPSSTATSVLLSESKVLLLKVFDLKNIYFSTSFILCYFVVLILGHSQWYLFTGLKAVAEDLRLQTWADPAVLGAARASLVVFGDIGTVVAGDKPGTLLYPGQG